MPDDYRVKRTDEPVRQYPGNPLDPMPSMLKPAQDAPAKGPDAHDRMKGALSAGQQKGSNLTIESNGRIVGGRVIRPAEDLPAGTVEQAQTKLQAMLAEERAKKAGTSR
jgi:hypothetical protein